MARQMLIYEGVVPVSQKRHGNWSVKTGADYGFARDVNSVPLMAAEFPFAAAEYPIVFAGNEEEVLPAVILGVRDGENVFYKEDTGWQGKYIPAFVRRYPFVFSVSEDGKQFTLCIDENFSGCNQEGRGERLFDSEGERSQYLAGILNFLKDYQAHFQRTQIFCKKLKELDLLEEMRAQFTLNTGQNLALQGFMAVSRERLKKLSGEQLADLVKTDELEMMYLHAQSMRNFRAMMERVSPGQAAPEEVGAPAEAPKPEAAKKAPAKKASKK
jgi:hypothetical protein